MLDGNNAPRILTLIGSCAALGAAIAVACGAFGAHALRGALPAERLATDMAIWEKAVLYHLIHVLAALMLVLTRPEQLSSATASAIAILLLGATCIFSGSLYLLVLTNTRWLGMITPLGGTGFIAAWVWLALALLRSR